jgi:starch synthase (maltosyl-transferring)
MYNPQSKPNVAFPKAYNVIIENIQPCLDGGAWPVKRELGDEVKVTADIYRHSFEKFEATLLWRKKSTKKWNKTPMVFVDNDEWTASFTPDDLGTFEYTIYSETVPARDKNEPSKAPQTFEVRIDPVYARYGSWYEMFPKSQGKLEGQSASWNDCTARLDDIQDMGFDAIYLVPCHPVGITNRKGPNNSLVAGPNDPGCPYAVGNTAVGVRGGGHFDLDPELGTEKQFKNFVKATKKRDMKLVLDLALNCSPDHPHVQEHDDWFYKEADGSIKFAENPPKKYEDIYPYNYYNEDYKNLWLEVRDTLVYWADQGFDIFRIDNPHTKPFLFWEWVIADVKSTHPHVVFLAEAFTRPKLMQRLAKLGFDQSYSYFTWRTEKAEIQEYLEELTQTELNEYMRANFFPTTPDIHPEHLKDASPQAFEMRLTLAATLSSVYGMLNGYELCEGKPNPTKDELWNSEKYDYKVRDWNAPGNIKSWVKAVNNFRKNNSALQEYDNLVFHTCENDKIMVYSKRDVQTGNIVLIVINLDTENTQAGPINLDLSALGKSFGASFMVHDQVDGQSYMWSRDNYVILDPKDKVAHLFVVD